MSALLNLAATLGELEHAMNVARRELGRKVDAGLFGDCQDIYMCQDTNGRFILLDALAQYANAQAIFTQLDTP
jgi:hypothetical protein